MASEHIAAMGSSEMKPGRQTFGKVSGMPLAMADAGKVLHVASIRGKDDVKRFLGNLGFAEGAEVMLISELSGNVIVNVKGTRVAISKAMAARILTV